MELGNMLFGNSRGRYPIKREVGFEQEFCRLFAKIQECNIEDVDSYGTDFEVVLWRT